MSTSASKLYLILKKTTEQSSGHTFAKAVMSAIDNPDGHDAEAFQLLSRQVQNVSSDLDVAFEGELLAHLQRQFAPFKNLLKFSPYDQQLANTLRSEGHFTNANTISNLLGIDAALQGKVERPDLSLTDDIKVSIEELRNNLSEIDLPSHIVLVIEKRISQVERAVRDFEFFGVGGLNEAMEALLGSVELYSAGPSSVSKALKKFKTSALTTILVVTGSMTATNAAINEGQDLISHFTDAVGYVEDMRESRSQMDEQLDDGIHPSIDDEIEENSE